MPQNPLDGTIKETISESFKLTTRKAGRACENDQADCLDR
jgi:hypothetical protein